jgi:predicted ArsR family transcriptional regulator
VLAVLGDDLNVQLVEACAHESRTQAELRDLTGASHATLTTRLQILEARGLLRREQARGPRGRPATAWRGIAREQLTRFSKVADQFVLNLLQAQVQDQAESMDERARSNVRLASGDTSQSAQ